MSRATTLGKQIERAMTGPMWHGPALAQVLETVTSEQAAARPIPGAHSIWEIVQHVTTELWVGFYKKASGKGGITYQDGVDAALCYGWIDGIKKRVDAVSYVHRFTPRRPGSIWSVVNTKRVAALIAEGLMAPPGLE